jgi:hypothetical protein
MMAMLSQAMAGRLTNFATQIKAQQQATDKWDDAAAEALLREALQPELDRLVQVPFGVPLLHEIG